MRIAQRFNAGKRNEICSSPVGTIDGSSRWNCKTCLDPNRPYGTGISCPSNPTHKWVGYFQPSLTGLDSGAFLDNRLLEISQRRGDLAFLCVSAPLRENRIWYDYSNIFLIEILSSLVNESSPCGVVWGEGTMTSSYQDPSWRQVLVDYDGS